MRSSVAFVLIYLVKLAMVQSTLPREFVLVVSIAMVIEFNEHQPSVRMLLEPMEDHQKYGRNQKLRTDRVEQ